jgi:hypothetical protein
MPSFLQVQLQEQHQNLPPNLQGWLPTLELTSLAVQAQMMQQGQQGHQARSTTQHSCKRHLPPWAASL